MATSFDFAWKLVLKWFLGRDDITFDTEKEVGQLPLTIDAVARCGERGLRYLREETLFDFFSRHNLLEFKSPNDPLTLTDFNRILGRAFLYASEQKIADYSEMVVCILCPRKPMKLLKQVGTFERVRAGVYRCHPLFNVYVIVTSELEKDSKNYPLLLFTGGRRRREFLEALVREGQVELLEIAYQVFPAAVKEVRPMPKGSKEWPTLEDNIKVFIEDLGAERIAALLPPEARLEGLPPEVRLEGLSPEARLEGLSREDLLKALAALEEKPSAKSRQRRRKPVRKKPQGKSR